MLSNKELAIARAHAEHQDDDLMLAVLDHIRDLQKLLDQQQSATRRDPTRPTSNPKRRPTARKKERQAPTPWKPPRPAWYPKEEHPHAHDR